MKSKTFLKFFGKKIVIMLLVAFAICTMFTCVSKKQYLMEKINDSVNDGKKVLSNVDLDAMNNWVLSNYGDIANVLGMLAKHKPNSVIVDSKNNVIAPQGEWAILCGTDDEYLLCDMSYFEGIDNNDTVICKSYWRNSLFFKPIIYEVYTYDKKRGDLEYKDEKRFHEVVESSFYFCNAEDKVKVVEFSGVKSYSQDEINEELGSEYKCVEGYIDAGIYYKSTKGFLKYDCYEYIYNGTGDYRLITRYEIDVWEIAKKVLLTVYIVSVVTAIVVAAFIALIDYKKYEQLLFQKTLTSSLAHDLKSPLMVVSGYVENITENTNPEKNEVYIQSIGQNVVHMNEIIQNILHLNEFQSKKHKKLAMEKCDIGVMIRSLLEMKEKQIKDKNVEVVVVGSAVIRCNKDAFSRAMDNLLGNAVTYSEEGKNIEVILDSGQMIINNYFNHSIEVNVKKLTEPFVKGNESRTSVGTGLGLNIAKSVMDLHGFKTRVEIENNIFKVRIKWKK